MKRVLTIAILTTSYVISAVEDIGLKKTPGVYFSVEAGASLSTKIIFAPNWDLMGVTEHSWTPPVSDSFETNFGTNKCIGAIIGYQFNPIISAEFSYDYRGKFRSIRAYGPTTDTTHGEVYSINCISSQTVMANMQLSPDVSWGGFVPYILGGIGVAINKTGELRNYDVYNQAVPISFDTRLRGKTCHSFAWQVGLGAHYLLSKHWQIGLGYRYIDIGKLVTSEYYTEVLTQQTGTVLPFIAKHPGFNEILASLVYCF